MLDVRHVILTCKSRGDLRRDARAGLVNAIANRDLASRADRRSCRN